MAHTPEIVDVRIVKDLGPAPMAFLWRGRLYVVRKVLASRTYDDGAATYDVLASTGRAHSAGRYVLRYVRLGWTLQQIAD